jgi:hypothetical protein
MTAVTGNTGYHVVVSGGSAGAGVVGTSRSASRARAL